jgi:hypothetical protein
VKLHARSNQNAVSPTIASPSNLVAVGRKLDRIHNYEANLLEEDNQAIAVAPIGGGRSMYGVSCRCNERLIWGNGFGSLRRLINRQRQTARGAGIRAYGHSRARVGPT